LVSLGLVSINPAARVWAAPFPIEPLAISAEYYFSRHDYRQSYQLWMDVFKRQPDSVYALLRVGELKLMFESRTATRDLLLKFLDSVPNKQNPDLKKEIKDKLKSVESIFISDEGLSLYLQAVSRTKRQDCLTAVTLFDHSAQLENGNLAVYLQRGKCEKTLGLYDRYFETFKLAYANDPYDREVIENLVDAELYFKQYARVVEILTNAPEVSATLSGKTALALALAEVGQSAEALPLMQSIIEQQKQSGFPAVLLFAVGKILSDRVDSSVEAMNYLDRFLGAASNRDAASLAGWDPYHYAQKIDSAKVLLARLKTSDGT
jgi:tetratricopeptide (TPR) repeat protein